MLSSGSGELIGGNVGDIVGDSKKTALGRTLKAARRACWICVCFGRAGIEGRWDGGGVSTESAGISLVVPFPQNGFGYRSKTFFSKTEFHCTVADGFASLSVTVTNRSGNVHRRPVKSETGTALYSVYASDHLDKTRATKHRG